jgi:hypothetical protein
MVTLDFLKFGAMFILWKAIMTLIVSLLINRNPDSATASGLSVVAL